MLTIHPSEEPGHTGTAPSGLRLHDLVRVLYRRRWLIASILITVVGLGIGYAVSATPLYEARTQLMVEAELPEADAFDRGRDEERNPTFYYQTQYEVLKSRTLARRTLDELGLWGERFDPPAFPSDSAIGRLLGWLRGLMALHASVAVTRPPDEQASRTISTFLDHLTISHRVESRLVEVGFESHDPKLAAAIANTLARLYAEHNVELRVTPIQEAANLFDLRLEEQQELVEASELALQRYIEEHDVASIGDSQSIMGRRLSDIAAALTSATAERMRREIAVEQLHTAGDDVRSLDAAPAILASPVVQSLKTELAALQQRLAEISERFGELHPQVIQVNAAIDAAKTRLAAEIATVVKAAGGDYQAALDRERRVEAQLQALRAAELADQRKGITYRALEQQVETNRAILDTLLKRAQETSISGQLTATTVQVVDPAEVPLSPVQPNRHVIVLLSGMLGMLLSVGLAFSIEFGSDRIRSVEAIRAGLGTRALGMTPARTRHGSQDRWTTRYLESMRGVRSNMLPAIAASRTVDGTSDSRGGTLLVTSPSPSEGKTTVAWSLAVVLAEATWASRELHAVKRPVVVVDADMRSPRLHEVFGVPRSPGLAELLAGTAHAREVVHASTFPGLLVIPAGAAQVNPAAQLASPRFKDILQALNRFFDWVVIDSPPMLPVTDASLIAGQGVAALMVVRADRTALRSARAAMEQMMSAGATVLGAVLNGVAVDRHPYYYAPLYRSDYGGYDRRYTTKRARRVEKEAV